LLEEIAAMIIEVLLLTVPGATLLLIAQGVIGLALAFHRGGWDIAVLSVLGPILGLILVALLVVLGAFMLVTGIMGVASAFRLRLNLVPRGVWVSENG
jgi:uncharacterized membrane protein HdeD (DUF308 family)